MSVKLNPKDYKNKKFGRLSAVRFDRVNPKKWIFKCDCGNIKSIDRYSVFCGDTQSCGCLHSENTSARSISHGHSVKGKVTPTFGSYRSMLQRCNDPSSRNYNNYGGRGIKICKRWLGKKGFINFLQDMGERPLHTSINRIDNNKNYTPNNCEWTTAKKQANNKRNNLLFWIDSEKLTLQEISEKFNLNYKNLYKRVITNNKPIEQCIKRGQR